MSAYKVTFAVSTILALASVAGAILYFLTACKNQRFLKLHVASGYAAALVLAASVVAVWWACTAHPGVRVGLTILLLVMALGGAVLGPIARRKCPFALKLLHYALGIVAVVLYLMTLRPVLWW